MNKLFFILCLLTGSSLYAQDYLTGKMLEGTAAPVDVLYDRTQYAVNATLYKAVYKVMDTKKSVLYSISLTHDQVKSSILVYIRPEGGTSKMFTAAYDVEKCGLILNDVSNLDTTCSMAKSYGYLISFTDVTRDYPILHKIRIDDTKEIELDPLSKLRLKKHNEMVRSILKTGSAPLKSEPVASEKPKKQTFAPAAAQPVENNDITKVAEEKRSTDVYQKDNFGAYLFTQRDSLYAKSLAYNKVVNKMVQGLEKDSITAFKGKKPGKDGLKYKGKKKSNKPEGKGILIVKDNIYEGTFKKGAFVSGKVIIRSEWYEYYGEFSQDTFNGYGWMKYKDGSYLVGVFKNGVLFNGVSLSKDMDGDLFFGTYQASQKTGYAELTEPKGNIYCGQFINGRLVKGYAKDVDRFGYSTYSRIDKGEKRFVEPAVGEKFFSSIDSYKKM